jgi:hypothetical protein
MSTVEVQRNGSCVATALPLQSELLNTAAMQLPSTAAGKQQQHGQHGCCQTAWPASKTVKAE